MKWLVQFEQNDEIAFEILFESKDDAEQYRKCMLVSTLNLFMKTKIKDDDLDVGIVETMLQAFLDKKLNKYLKSYKVLILEKEDDIEFIRNTK